MTGQSGRRWLGLAALIALTVVTGCTSYRGVAEFSVYRTRYEASAALGNDILDRVAVGERALYAFGNPFDAKLTPFDPDLARYYVTSVDPPATAAYRKTIDAVEAFNDALYGLASGEDAAALAARVTRLSAIGAAAAADLAALGGAATPAPAGAGVAAAATVNAVLAGLEPLTAEVIGFQYRETFRARLLEQAPTIRRAILASRETTPEVFDKLRFPLITAADADPSRRGRLTPGEVAEIERSNALVATWVVLLDAALAAFDIAVDAVERDDGQGSFEGLLLASENLGAAVAAARRNLAGGD